MEQVLAKLTELTVGVNELRADRANQVTRQDLQEFHEKSMFETKAFVLSQTDPMNESVTELLKSSVENFDRVGKLESRVQKLESRGPGKFDDSFAKLAVEGFNENAKLEDHLGAMKSFMEKNFPKIDAKFSVIHKGSWGDKGKNRKMTGVGLIDVGCPDLRELLVKTVESKGLKVQSGGKELKVVRALTRSASDRNKAIREAADLLKKQKGLQEKDVVPEWAGDRGVKVKGMYAFKQPKGRELGAFCGAFVHLKLP